MYLSLNLSSFDVIHLLFSLTTLLISFLRIEEFHDMICRSCMIIENMLRSHRDFFLDDPSLLLYAITEYKNLFSLLHAHVRSNHSQSPSTSEHQSLGGISLAASLESVDRVRAEKCLIESYNSIYSQRRLQLLTEQPDISPEDLEHEGIGKICFSSSSAFEDVLNDFFFVGQKEFDVLFLQLEFSYYCFFSPSFV